jgi:DNA-binding NarL/FixJ family response regulator
MASYGDYPESHKRNADILSFLHLTGCRGANDYYMLKEKSPTRRAEIPAVKVRVAPAGKDSGESKDQNPRARSTNENPQCEPPEAKRIVIVDDHPLFRKGLEEMIHSDGSFAVCGEAGNTSEAMEVIRKQHPDMAIVDISLPGANGIELIKNIRAECPRLPILVLSMHDESLYAMRAMRAGAEGYVMKHEAMANVIHAIREVFNGRPYLSPAMAAQVITKFAHREGEGEVDAVERLSDRELEILELIGKGKDVRQIAKLLHLSPKTVETHRSHIKDKLDLKNSREVARFALQWLNARNE